MNATEQRVQVLKYKVLIFQDQPRHVRWSASRAEDGPAYRFVYLNQEGYARNPPQTFASASRVLPNIKPLEELPPVGARILSAMFPAYH